VLRNDFSCQKQVHSIGFAGPPDHHSFSFERNHISFNKVEHPEFDVMLYGGQIVEGEVGNATSLSGMLFLFTLITIKTDEAKYLLYYLFKNYFYLPNRDFSIEIMLLSFSV